MKKLMAIALLIASNSAWASSVAITGATIHTLGSQGTIENGVILIRDGVIVAIGGDVAVPASAKVIAAAGSVITPGIFDPYSYLGITEIDLVSETVDGKQSGQRFTAGFDVATAINPRSTLIPINRIEGVTHAMVAPTPGNEASLLSGLGSIIHLGDSDSSLVRPRAALFAHLGEVGAGLTYGSRAAAMIALREALNDARDYGTHRADYDQARRRDYALGRIDLEALQPVISGEIPVVATVRRSSDILALLELAREQQIEVVVYGGDEAWLVAAQLADQEVAVILDPTRNLPERFEALNASLENAARLQAAGVDIAFATNDSHNSRNIRQLAGNAVANGMPWLEALRSITVVPLKIYKNDSGGVLEAGKAANLVVWDGDPLEVTTFANHVFINGTKVPMRSRQTLLRDRYLEADGNLPSAYRKP